MSAGPIVPLAQSIGRVLLQIGVVEVVVCAGARNAALVAVLARSPALRLWSFPEERSAGFFALGRARSLAQPVAIVTTSGTAAAELLPAAVEAHYQARPLVLVTADRPRSYRGTGAPQAIEQVGLFGPYAAATLDIASREEMTAMDAALAEWTRRRPIHLNVCFDEPEGDELALAEGVSAGPWPAPPPRGDGTTVVERFLAGDGPLIAVAGDLPSTEQAGAAACLQALGCPVVAEATSGLREHPSLKAQLLRGGEASLASLPVRRVLRVGGVPSLRWWRDLENRPEIDVLSLSETGFAGLARPTAVAPFPDWSAVRGMPVAPVSLEADRERARRVTAVLAAHPDSEPALVRAVSEHPAAGSLIFLGNSLPVREWNAFASTEDRGLRCHANRGANGIDGCVSTFLALSADEAESWCLVGDLTALYDLAAPWIAPVLPPARRRIVVINNGGGKIFRRLPSLRGLEPDPRRLMENPHRLHFRAWAELWGWDYARIATAADFAMLATGSPHLIVEFTPDAGQTERCWAALAA